MAAKIKIAVIVAAAENGVIGRGGIMPWHMPSDLRYFRRVTLGKPVIMGRKTFEAIGRPLPKRHNIVVSRDPGLQLDGAEVIATLDAAIAHAQTIARATGVDEVMVIGGGQIYAQALPLADRVYLTRIHTRIDGDATFPELDPDVWTIIERTPSEPDVKDQFAAEFMVFARCGTAVRDAGLDGAGPPTT
jgi:dihydrofolate reductase